MDDVRAVLAGRFSRRTLVIMDVVFGVLVASVVWANLAAGAWAPQPGLPMWFAWAVSVALGVPLTVRRVWPLPAFAVAIGLWVATGALGIGWAGVLIVAFVLHAVAAELAMTPSVIALVVALVSAVGPSLDVLSIAITWTVLVLTWVVGRANRERRIMAAREADQRARAAVGEERLRIARELHDIVAHGMSVIAVKASVANHVAESNPAEARVALVDIEATSREALADLRRMLGVLRSTKDGVPVDPAPAPAGLADLADRAGMAGVKVDLEVRGVDDLPDGVGLSVYRIVQEALTNVVRHAAPARCQVTVDGTEGVVTIDVTDDGPGGSVAGSGHGLIGMRERVSLYGGEFSAGPRPEGGFAVHARLPYAEASS
ncbi:Signal transduction histidine kinase [Actinokineospora alba]|uniref:histidine kinase n=1 Tax=Actinokineospora alba TaxID=504798 RepID=A0A1H0RLI1_9PSEU|nr:sensor histidine kinase [Actinokineospora alba]TDP67025.1 signal transduction histidine kinase [Actinokineospora alba]SDJ31362.1 Signal transduction histidine kinase [Actinokineospora alba]SDP30250.1 Signal transduction histidine kinase [Actinokineospora alba]